MHHVPSNESVKRCVPPWEYMYLSSGIYWSLVVIWTINQTFQRVVTCQKDFWTSANLQCFRDKSLFSFSEYLRIYLENLIIRVLLFYGQCQEVFRTHLSTSFPRDERLLGYMLLFIFTLAFPLYSFHWRRLNFHFEMHSWPQLWSDLRTCLYTSIHMKKFSVTKLWSKKCSMILYTCL